MFILDQNPDHQSYNSELEYHGRKDYFKELSSPQIFKYN